jgi:ribosomal protein S12 methylthiotransferase accessory factor
MDPYIAARRALTEATQSRVTAIQGSREDLSAGAIAPSDPPADWFENPEMGIPFRELSGTRNRDLRDDITDMLERLAAAGLARAVAVDVSNRALGFPVIRVLVPGLEPAFHDPSAGQIALGWRARRYVADAA